VTGLLVDPLDAAAIADAMARLLADPDMRQRMGRAGRLRAETSFRWGAVAQRIVPGLMDGPA
jgi:glycosyltransferase involved in cell wall biosynthesis